MKRVLILIVTVMMLGLAVQAYADSATTGTARVMVNVDPIIAITPGVPPIPTVQFGVFTIPVPFTIGANYQTLRFSVMATDLYKADVVGITGQQVPPIPLVLTRDCLFQLTSGNAINGLTNVIPAPFARLGSDVINTLPAYTSSSRVFQSSQAGHFSQDVTLSCFWNQNDNEKPKGQYSGFVRLIGVVVPD
ncbi:MAG TPA: hypothetical protein VLS90_10335 [Thermodesulfobacteriota bacterium]|nr:hypothetical protein [Thermodesulfobacteriota bacterium]